VPVEGHARQAVEPAAEHSLHEEWQLVHTEFLPTVSAKVPPGHCSTHVPLETNGVVVLVHEIQWEAVPPVHVPQLKSHSSQTLDAFANLPRGVQSAMQVPRL